jgi:hypothetical protein
MVAETTGPQVTLTLAGVVVLLALVPGVTAPDARPLRPPAGKASWATPLPSWRLLALGLLGAAPQRLLLTGVVAFEVPRYLSAGGAGWAEIGRIVALWALPPLLLRPILIPAMARRGQGLAVGLGGLLSGAALLPPLFVDLGAWLPAATLLLGVGQALSGAGFAPLATRIASSSADAARSSGGLAVLRGCGWLGAVAGPPAVAGLLAFHTGTAAVVLLGAAEAACAVLLSTLYLFAGYRPEPALDLVADEAHP